MKSVFLVSTILAAATLVQPAVAQEGAPAAETGVAAHDGGEGAIVVTARRREESLQSIPAAVSATAQEDRSRASATSIAAVARLTPGQIGRAAGGGSGWPCEQIYVVAVRLK